MPETVEPWTEAELEQRAEAALLLLRGRSVTEILGSGTTLEAGPGPVTMGAAVPVKLRIRNVFPEALELRAPESGIRLEFAWSLARWLPYGGRDEELSTRHAAMEGPLRLAPGEEFVWETPFQLAEDRGFHSLWESTLAVKIRLAGVKLGERELPVSELRPDPANFLALPAGWQSLSREPLAQLERTLSIGAAAADRHVLVCAALLAEEEREAAVELLASQLPDAPNPQRAGTMTTALSWLTGLDLGDAPAAWNAWWEQRRMSRR